MSAHVLLMNSYYCTFESACVYTIAYITTCFHECACATYVIIQTHNVGKFNRFKEYLQQIFISFSKPLVYNKYTTMNHSEVCGRFRGVII